MRKIALFAIVISLMPPLFTAVPVSAQVGPFAPWIVCGEDLNNDGMIDEECSFKHLGDLLNNLIKNMVIASTFLATLAFAWAGFLMIKGGSNPGVRDEAKKIFQKVMMGYLLILTAWIVVYTITSVFLAPEYMLLKP